MTAAVEPADGPRRRRARPIARGVAIAVAVACATSSSASDGVRPEEDARCAPVRLEITRRALSPSCTLGTLTVNGVEVGYTLEKGYAGNISDVSSIPGDRTYEGSMRADGARGWRVEMGGVPGRSNVQIHVGNYPEQSKGCVLLGSSIDRRACAVWNSKKAMGTLRAVMGEDPAGGGSPCPERKVTVEVRGLAHGEQQVGCYDRTRCVQQVKVKTGKACGSSDSMTVVWKNVCDDAVKVHVCFARPDGTFDCGLSRIRAGREQTDWTCHATGVHMAAFHVNDPERCFEDEEKRWRKRPAR